MHRKILCEQANQMDLVNYLEKLGHIPEKIKNNDYWYLSPLRDEKTASFKVNRKLNLWYDHGTGRGGNLVDFGILYYKCSVKELLYKLEKEKGLIFSLHPHLAVEKKDNLKVESKILILNCREIISQDLHFYLENRAIPLDIARQFCKEIDFKIYDKKHTAIGFQNSAGGYELRNHYFKGSSSPKEPKLIQKNGDKELAVFEGFFSFLSFQALQQSLHKNAIDLSIIHVASLVLNSLSFFEKSREMMEQYSKIHLFLDRDLMGIKCTNQALKWSDKYIDQSKLYKQFEDLNEYLIKSVNPKQKQSLRLGRHF